MNFERESFETGNRMPLLGAQTAVADSKLIDDESGELVMETLILPNLVCYLHFSEGVRVGESLITSPQFAHKFEVALAEHCEKVTECDCDTHDGRTMYMEDLYATILT